MQHVQSTTVRIIWTIFHNVSYRGQCQAQQWLAIHIPAQDYARWGCDISPNSTKWGVIEHQFPDRFVRWDLLPVSLRYVYIYKCETFGCFPKIFRSNRFYIKMAVGTPKIHWSIRKISHLCRAGLWWKPLPVFPWWGHHWSAGRWSWIPRLWQVDPFKWLDVCDDLWLGLSHHIYIYTYIYIYTNIHIQTMTNQLFCLATHLRLAMLCLQLGKSCWVLVLDSFFRHEEMSQLRFAETLFSCQFFRAGYAASNELQHGGNGKTNQNVGEMMMMMMMMMFIVSTTFVIIFKLLLLHMTMLHCHDYQYFLPTQRRFFWLRTSLFGTSVGCPVVLWRCLERIQHCQTWFHGTNIQRIYFLRYI